MEKFDLILMACKKFIAEKFSHLSAEAVGWLAIVFVHCATIPSVLSLMIGLSDKLPSLDVVLFDTTRHASYYYNRPWILCPSLLIGTGRI